MAVNQDFRVPPISFYVYDATFSGSRIFKKVMTMSNYSSLTYTNNYVEKNIFTMDLQKGNERTLELIRQIGLVNLSNPAGVGTMIIMVNDDNPLENGRVTTLEDTEDGITIGGSSLFGLFEKFRTIPENALSTGQPNDKIEVKDVPVTQAIKEIIDRTFINPDEPRASLPLFADWFEIVNEPDFGVNISMYGRFDDLFIIVQRELEANEIGIRIEFDPFSLQPFKIKFYQGIERPSVELTIKNQALTSYNYSIDVGQTINSSTALGADSGSEREVEFFEKTAELNSQGESNKDARDVDAGDTEGLIDRARSNVIDNERTDTFSAEYNQTNEAFLINVDFFLGDKINFAGEIFGLFERLNKITTVYSQNDGKVISFDVDKELSPINNIFKSIEDRMSKVENYTRLDFT